MILFTQSTAVLHKYLNDELKILCLLQFFPEFAHNSLRIPRVFYAQRNLRVFQVFQVCGHPALLLCLQCVIFQFHHHFHKLEKVALDGSVECCAPPPRWCDLEL